uniref:Putative rRNA-processing protein EBP2 n=1 Tax=Lygus hesperus TaxID=30085 RepID=A0A0A9XG04_LYGHE
MYKSDAHMNDIKRAMEAAKARVEAQAHRRAMKDQKKYGKEVQAEVLRQRAKYKRDLQDNLSDWKKKRKGSDALQSFLHSDLNEEEDGGGEHLSFSRGRPGFGGKHDRDRMMDRG